MTIPIIKIAAADPYERGVQIGQRAGARIAESVAAYEETFLHYTGLPWSRVTEIALEFRTPIEDYDGAILAEIEGIATGAGLTIGDLLALNARSEIMYGLNVPLHPECTSFFAAPSATVDGHALLGQNWDWRPRARDAIVLLEVDQGPGAPGFVTLPEAGLVGKMGFNACGVGVTLNVLASDLDRGERLVPVHVILRSILNARTLEEAFVSIVKARRSASANYTIAGADGEGFAVEVGPGGIGNVHLRRPVDGVLAHANHFVARTGFADAGVPRWPDSLRREEVMADFLRRNRGRLDAEKLKEILRDTEGHPGAICRAPDPGEHPVERSATVASLIMDLEARTAEIAVGPPDEADYFAVTPQFEPVEARP